jgi:hypothetical protein
VKSKLALATQATYVLTAGGLTAVGALAQSPWYYVAATIFTLPHGVLSFIGIYVGYAVLKGVGGLMLTTTTPTGDDAVWLSVASGILNVVLFTVAALANLLLLRLVKSARRSSNRATGSRS